MARLANEFKHYRANKKGRVKAFKILVDCTFTPESLVFSSTRNKETRAFAKLRYAADPTR